MESRAQVARGGASQMTLVHTGNVVQYAGRFEWQNSFEVSIGGVCCVTNVALTM